ncbi:MAG: 4'-phosphopantetheinyl transferase superfamily protein [Gammaproteobacteria bacterium]|nr:MAG: 4'-phosphopantetheinyl transferase superfamily protein [Gammaproteobacteria bacterium]
MTLLEWQSVNALDELKDNEAHIWLFHLNTTPPGIKRFYPLLSLDEKERSERFVDFMHRKRFIASHGFLRSVLALYMDIPAEELVFRKGNNGKPYLDMNNEQTAIHFNLSHSQHLAMVAVCKQHEIGIDVECMERKHEWQKLIKRFFTEPEQNAIFALPADRQHQAFFEVWTRKEAHMKVTGKGLHLSPTQFTVSVPPLAAALIEDRHVDDITQWRMYDLTLPPSARHYCATFSVHGKIDGHRQFIFN